MATLSARLLALESATDNRERPLPHVVADDTPDDELARLRRSGCEVYRLSDALELFV